MSEPYPLSASFAPGSASVGPRGQMAHAETLEHTERLGRRFYRVGEHAWCLVGNGLSNQTFIEGPAGVIAIDTGECVEEMSAALGELRGVTDRPVSACIYTHFHYVNGTRALLSETAGEDLPIYGHAKIEANLSRYAGEIQPRVSRGSVHQFGMRLPAEGPDGLVNVGIGRFYRDPDHAPFTPGHLAPTVVFDAPHRAEIAGLAVEMTPAASDADDSITIWFPELRIAVNNIIWPALFNVFAIRSEEYRDPRVLLAGMDHLLSLEPEHLIATHGPPLSGAAAIRDAVTDSRDAIQFLWDQTVRGVNRGLTLDELTTFVQLPERFRRSYFTRQYYGLAEHHVRQIHSGLFGWFDEDEARLLPLPAPERARRLIAGFGGHDAVRGQVDGALASGDFRWAIELASWLVRSELNREGRADGGAPQDRERLAGALRGAAYNTTSANLRNWCLTRALELDGRVDLSRFRRHGFRPENVLASPPETWVPVLRVLLDPARASGLYEEIRFEFEGGSRAGLLVRDCVAVPTSGAEATLALSLNHATWADLLGGRTTLAEAIDGGAARATGPLERIRRVLSTFDIPAFR